MRASRLLEPFPALALAFLLCLPVRLGAAPDFARTSITASSATPLEGDVVRFTVVLRNTGDAAADHTQLDLEWPQLGYFVGLHGLEATSVDHERRKIEGSVSLPAGAERTLELDVLAPRDAGGDTLTLALHAAHYPSQTEHWDRAGLGALAWLALGSVLWLVAPLLAGAGRPVEALARVSPSRRRCSRWALRGVRRHGLAGLPGAHELDRDLVHDRRKAGERADDERAGQRPDPLGQHDDLFTGARAALRRERPGAAVERLRYGLVAAHRGARPARERAQEP